MVGKTAIISQFLYDSFVGRYKETVDDMYQGEFDVAGYELTLNIQVWAEVSDVKSYCQTCITIFIIK